jgi:hypothetical protein
MEIICNDMPGRNLESDPRRPAMGAAGSHRFPPFGINKANRTRTHSPADPPNNEYAYATRRRQGRETNVETRDWGPSPDVYVALRCAALHCTPQTPFNVPVF